MNVSNRQTEIADKAYERLLASAERISPELKDLVRQKYEDDRREFAEAAKKWVPSEDPAYWAKDNCSKCYSRGITGKRYVFLPGDSARVVKDEDGNKTYENAVTKVDVSCTCTEKTFKAWLAEFRLFWNMLRAKTLEYETQKEDQELLETLGEIEQDDQ